MAGERENCKLDLDSQRICKWSLFKKVGRYLTKRETWIGLNKEIRVTQLLCGSILPNQVLKFKILHEFITIRASAFINFPTISTGDLPVTELAIWQTCIIIKFLGNWSKHWNLGYQCDSLFIPNHLIMQCILRFKLLTEFFQISIQKKYIEKHKFYFLAKNFETYFFNWEL